MFLFKIECKINVVSRRALTVAARGCDIISSIKRTPNGFSAKMSLFLPKLSCKKDIDEVIKGVAEKVVVLRFGRDEDSVCLQLDEIVSGTLNVHTLSKSDGLQLQLMSSLFISVVQNCS